MIGLLKRITSLLLVTPLTLSFTDIVYEESNKSNKFERVINEEVTYPSQTKQARYQRIVEEATRVENERLKQEHIKYIEELREKERIAKEQKRLEEQKKKQIQSRGLSGEGNILFELTFYTDLPEENGGHTITASGKPLEYGVVASNKYPIGTKLRLGNMGTFTVEDRGGREFNNSNRLDVFIPRQFGESNQQYKNRVRNMGRIKLKGDIL